MPSDLLDIQDLTVEYAVGKQRIMALNDVAMNIPSTSYTLGLVGESGSGKTTLGMSVLNAIEPPGKVTGGRIEWEGKNILEMRQKELRRYRWQQVSMVYQSAMNSLNPVKNVRGHITEVIRQHTNESRSESSNRALQLLSEVGINPDRSGSYSHEFSGGMRQRVAIAMALALNPKLLIADEPTSALDVVIQRQIIDLLKAKIKERGMSLLFITHEIALLPGLVDEVMVMYAGQIAEKGPTSKVLLNPLHPYTEMLIGSLLSSRESLKTYKRKKMEDIAPAFSTSTKKLCIYASRCKYAFDRCTREKPMLREVEAGRWVACHKYD